MLRFLVTLSLSVVLLRGGVSRNALAQAEGVKEPSQPDPIELLSQRRQDVQWERASLLLAEVTLDRETDAVVLGVKKESVFVGIVEGPFSNSSRHWVLEFAASSSAQDGLCGSPDEARDQIEKLSIPEDAPKTCDSAEVARECRRWRQMAELLYLAAARGSKGISLGDAKCDSFHIYFDPVQRQPVWWRR